MTISTPNFASFDLVDVEWLQQRHQSDPNLRVIDVRTGGEFETVHIPGSYNIPLNTLGEHVHDLADIDHPVVLVCQSGNRASQAHGKLSRAGKETLHILDGGINSWQDANADVIRGTAQRWAMDRQVRLVAGAIVLTGIVVSTVFPKAKWVAGAIGAGLTFSAVSNTCAMGNALSKLPYNRTKECDVAAVLAELSREEG